MKLEAFWKTYDLELVVNFYANNWRLYLGLVDTSDWEPFCDITENHPEIDDHWMTITEEWEKVIIDNDFLMCFDTKEDCVKWLTDNLHGMSCASVNGRPTFYIIKDKLPNERRDD